MSFPLNLEKILRKDIQSMPALVNNSADYLTKLDSMEMPYRLPVNIQEKLGKRLGALEINRYPSHYLNKLYQAIITRISIPSSHDIIIGNGASELISLLSLVCSNACDSQQAINAKKTIILTPAPSFNIYSFSASLYGIKLFEVPLTPEFELNENAMLEAIQKYEPSIIYLAYPNNPTTNFWDETTIEKIIASAPGIVVIDEAYQAFSSRTYTYQLEQHQNIVIIHSFSKSGLAGARIGYLIAHKQLIEQLNKAHMPHNVSALNAECALFALEYSQIFAEQAHNIYHERDMLIQALRALSQHGMNLRVWDSQSNMILLRVSDNPDTKLQQQHAQNIFEKMKFYGVLIKNVSSMHHLLSGCLNITVGTHEENAKMLSALIASIS